MADSPGESSSDLARARDLSRRLREGEPAPAPQGADARPGGGFSAHRARAFAGVHEAVSPAPPAGAPGQVARAAGVAPPAGASPARAVPRHATPMAVPMVLPPPPAEDTWAAILDWCRASLSADSAFVIDVRGLLVANSGALSDDDAQAMGARLVAALAQADELERGTPVRILVVDLANRRLTGIRMQTASGIVLTLGLVSARPLASGATALVRKAFSKRLADG